MASTNLNIKLDSNLKKQSEALYNELGISLETAISIFLNKSLDIGGFPFDVRLDEPNKETLLALLEAEEISKDPNAKGYFDVEEALKELKR